MRLVKMYKEWGIYQYTEQTVDHGVCTFYACFTPDDMAHRMYSRMPEHITDDLQDAINFIDTHAECQG